MRAIRQTSGRPVEKEETTFKGELTKITPEMVLEKQDKKLQKIEERTEKLIQQSEKRKAKTVVEPLKKHSSTVVKALSNHSLKLPNVSYLDFLIMKGIKKLVLKEIEKNIFFENSECFSFIDTEIIRKEHNVPSNILRDAIFKLKKEKWFEPIRQQYTKRLVKIEIQNYKNTQQYN